MNDDAGDIDCDPTTTTPLAVVDDDVVDDDADDEDAWIFDKFSIE